MSDTKDLSHRVLDHELMDVGFKENNELTIESIESQILKINNTSLACYEDNDDVKSQSGIKDFYDHKVRFPFTFKKSFDNYFFKKTTNWIGIIMEIDDLTFKAKLIDKSQEGTFEIAVIDLKEVSKSDRELINLGSVFYYTLGYSSYNGQIKKESFIRFKRSVPFDSFDLDTIENRVDELDNKINWE